MPHVKTPFLFLLLFVFCASVGAQNWTESREKIRRAVRERDHASAVAELETLRRADRKMFDLNNYDYLLARLLERGGNHSGAAALFQASVNRNSILSEYALRHLSEIARSSGNLMLERVYLQQLLAVAPPESLLKNAADARLTRSYFESGDFAAAIERLKNPASFGEVSAANQKPPAAASDVFGNLAGASDARTRENLVFLGNAYLQTGKPGEARQIFTKLITDQPNPGQPDDFTLAAAKRLDALDAGENFGKQAPALADAEHLRRALIYQFNRDFAAARLHYRAIVERYPQSPNAPDAMYQIGRGYALEQDFQQAIIWFERGLAEFPAHPLAKDALSQAANAYARVNKPRESLSRYQRLIQQFPESENLERAYLNLIDVLRDTGEDTEALNRATETREKFRGRPAEAVALFTRARIRLAQNNWAGALNDLSELQNFSDLGGARAPGGTSKAEIVFLKAYALERLGRFSEAVEIYLSIPDGRNEYYGWRATERLRELAKNENAAAAVLDKSNALRTVAGQALTPQTAESVRAAAQQAVRLTVNEALKNQLLETIKNAYALLPAYQKIPNPKFVEPGRTETLKTGAKRPENYRRALADELLFLGLYDEAAPLWEEAAKVLKGENEKQAKPAARNPKPEDFAYTLAVIYNRGDAADRAVRYAEPLWRNVPADYQIELIPREQAELLYPAPYAESLLRYAPERGVDPRFALSIMRQESRFQAGVKSYAAARGLMQFISSTADRIAGDLGRRNFEQDELYHPPTAILFGLQYLSNLFKQFPRQPQAVAASYNGGEHNVSRWLARAKSLEADRYVPEILFMQSKDYVYRVMANYRVYQTIYGENLK